MLAIVMMTVMMQALRKRSSCYPTAVCSAYVFPRTNAPPNLDDRAECPFLAGVILLSFSGSP